MRLLQEQTQETRQILMMQKIKINQRGIQVFSESLSLVNRESLLKNIKQTISTDTKGQSVLNNDLNKPLKGSVSQSGKEFTAKRNVNSNRGIDLTCEGFVLDKHLKLEYSLPYYIVLILFSLIIFFFIVTSDVTPIRRVLFLALPIFLLVIYIRYEINIIRSYLLDP